MKKIILALVAVFALSMSVQAQEEKKERPEMPNQEEMVQRMTDMMAENLGLSADQKEAVLAINKEYAGKLMPQMHHPRGPKPDGENGEKPENFGEKLEQAPEAFEHDVEGAADKAEGKVEAEKAREEYKEALKAVLTEEQLSKYEEMEKGMNHRGDHKGGPRGKGPRAEKDGQPGPAPVIDEPEGEKVCHCPEVCECKGECADECKCEKKCPKDGECKKECPEGEKKECPEGEKKDCPKDKKDCPKD